LVLDRATLAVVVGMGGFVVLLLAGTQIFAWFWIALLAVASLAAGLYTLRGRIPSAYAMAQLLDRRLKLADSLSTATYFASPEAQGDPGIRERQRMEAEALAPSVDLQQGVPFIRPRYGVWAAALAAVALGLVATRYAVVGSLDLKPGLVQIAFDSFFNSQQFDKNALAKMPRRHGPPSFAPVQASDDPEPANDPMEAKLEAMDNLETNMTPQADAGNDQAMQSDSPSPDGNSDKEPNNKGPEGDKQDDKQSKNSKSGSDKTNRSGGDQSLMDKIKDALSGVMNKMNSDPKNEQQEQAKNGEKSDPSDKSDRSKDKKQGKGEQDQSAKNQEQQQDDPADGGKTKTAQSNQSPGDKNAQTDAQNGAGAEDGEKAVERAAQLAAMGKLSELFGKRALNVSGEMLVEVGNSKQQIKTPYAQRQANHTDAGGEINRDEIPLMYQQFVTEYFDQIHKANPAAPTKASEKAAVNP